MRSRALARLFQRRPWLPPLLPRGLAVPWPTFPDDLCLVGEHVALRWPRPSDAEDVFAYAGDEAVSAFMDWNPHRAVDESRRFLGALERSRRAGREAAFGVIARDTGRLIGICSFVRGPEAEIAELGYALRRSAWGRGYMTEAVRLACPWAFGSLPLDELFAEVHPDNRASQRVLEKSGFVRQPNPVLRSIKGIRSPHYQYRRLREE